MKRFEKQMNKLVEFVQLIKGAKEEGKKFAKFNEKDHAILAGKISQVKLHSKCSLSRLNKTNNVQQN